MTVTLRDLLDARTTRAYDVDEAGRTLVGHDDSGTIQLYEISADGQWTQLTHLPDSCRGKYLPGERAVVVEHDVDGTERYQLSLLRLDGPAPELEPLVHDPAYVHHLVDVLPGRVVFTTNRRNDVDFDVVVRDVAAGEDHVRYDAGGYVGSVALSPDERWLVLTRPGEPANSTQLVLVETSSGRLAELTPAAEPTLNHDPVWAPDSASFTVASNSGRQWMGVRKYTLATKSWEFLDEEDTWDVHGWPSPDGARMLTARNVDGIHQLAVDGVPAPWPGEGVLMRMTEPIWAPDGSRFVATYASPTEPGDVWVVTLTGEPQLHRLTDSSPDLHKEELVTPAVHRAPAPDGSDIPCFVYRPASPDGSAVITVHGGPEAQGVRTWNPLVQALVAQGHTVLQPNVRGSTGYGKAWYEADDTVKRLDSVADLAALHAWLPSLGLDPARAALHGGSYGGYMVLAGLSMQPELWAAGVDIVGISSLVTFLENTSAYRRSHREREYGSLSTDREFLVRASPITYIDDVRAPLLILHGANDPRVPVSEAEQIAAALESRGVPCELVVYADEGHGFGKRHTLYDSQPKIVEFLGSVLGER